MKAISLNVRPLIFKIVLVLVAMYFLGISQVCAKGGKSRSMPLSPPPAMSEYLIGTGDVLSISTWKEKDLTFENVVVRNDGKITFPLLDDIQARGRTTMELKYTIQKGLEAFLDAPMVTVTLMNPGSQKYYILGEVQETGEYPIMKKLTVVQAFALAKGFTQWASKDKIILFRKSDGKNTMVKIDYDDIVGGDLSQDVYLQADDIIIVP